MNQRKLFIHETTDNLKKFWLLNPHSNFYELLCQITGNIDFGFRDDQRFAGDIEFELEQIEAGED